MSKWQPVFDRSWTNLAWSPLRSLVGTFAGRNDWFRLGTVINRSICSLRWQLHIERYTDRCAGYTVSEFAGNKWILIMIFCSELLKRLINFQFSILIKIIFNCFYIFSSAHLNILQTLVFEYWTRTAWILIQLSFYNLRMCHNR